MMNEKPIGDHAVVCDICGLDYLYSECRKMWNGWLVCPKCWQRKHPLSEPVTLPVEQPIRDIRSEETIAYLTTGPAADPDGICEAQQPSAPGDLTINGALASGGEVTLDPARPVTVSSTGCELHLQVILTGLDINGDPVVLSTVGPFRNTITFDRRMSKVTKVTLDGVPKGKITIGTGMIFKQVTKDDL